MILQVLHRFLSKGDKRSVQAKKNIAATFIIRASNIAIGLLLVPLTINYLNPTKYGIWITLSTIIGWFGFFDIGLGHGLRNRFAEAVAAGNFKLAKIYVSTTYAILALVIGGLLLLYYLINPFLNWIKILNVENGVEFHGEINILVQVVFTFFCLRFIFKLITTILLADQKPARASVFDLIGKVLSLSIIFILTKITQESILYIGITMSGVPVIVLLVSTIWFFNGKYKAYKPSIKSIDWSKASGLLSLGMKFFMLQIASILLYQTNNIIIAQLFGSEQVTSYYVIFKYYSILVMGFSIILTPYWSAITEAWVKKEKNWIKKTINRLVHIWLVLLAGGILMFFISPIVFKIWIGDKVVISYSLTALVGISLLMNSWNGIFSNFLNGIGKLRIQLYLGTIAALLNVPLALFLGMKVGIVGVIIANICVVLPGTIIYPIQYRKLINGQAQGVFQK